MEHERHLSRRALLRAGAASALAALTLPRTAHARHTPAIASRLMDSASSDSLLPARPPVGLQLYTVRALMQRDVPGTLAALAAAGVREVEFAGYFDRSAASLRALLDARRARRAGRARAHPDRLVAGARRRRRRSATAGSWCRGWDRTCARRWTAGAGWPTSSTRPVGSRAGRGLRMAYHNHDFEFTVTEGRVPFDVLVERARSVARGPRARSLLGGQGGA